VPCGGDWTGRTAKLEMTHIFQAHVPSVGDPCLMRGCGGPNRQDVVEASPHPCANHVEEDSPFNLGGVPKNGDDVRLVIDLGVTCWAVVR
jgi:hypothetical protein